MVFVVYERLRERSERGALKVEICNGRVYEEVRGVDEVCDGRTNVRSGVNEKNQVY